MRWWTLLLVAVATAAVAKVSGPRRCAGRLARERLKAAEKIRDKRFYLYCCTNSCVPTYRRHRPPSTTRRYQPYHRTWYGLKYGMFENLYFVDISNVHKECVYFFKAFIFFTTKLTSNISLYKFKYKSLEIRF